MLLIYEDNKCKTKVLTSRNFAFQQTVNNRFSVGIEGCAFAEKSESQNLTHFDMSNKALCILEGCHTSQRTFRLIPVFS